MKERERKRKRELGMEEDEEGATSDDAANVVETKSSNKRQKQESTAEELDAKKKAIADKKREKREKKKEKDAKIKAKKEAKKAAKQDKDLEEVQAERRKSEDDAGYDDDGDDGPAAAGAPVDMDKLELDGLGELQDEAGSEDGDAPAEDSSAPTTPVVDSPAFDLATNHSEASSSSSIAPPSTLDEPKGLTQTQPSTAKPQLKLDLSQPQSISSTQKPLPPFADVPSGTSSPKIQLPNIDQAELQERLRKRIEELRAKRKADGGDGKPAKSRQELLEQRRKKEEQRKAHKKELRRQAKEDEARKREEQLRGSGSPMSADIFSRSSPRPQENNFSFSRLAFEDGTAANASLNELQDPRKKKGPQDPHTALQAAEKKQSRLAGLDAEKRADIAEKDMWLNAKKRAHGERVRDDTSLLKKALKRKEKQKGKSEKEWKEREQAVVKGKEMKQKKREANLQKRREEKGQKGKKKASSGKGKKKARPGFEGRFKA